MRPRRLDDVLGQDHLLGPVGPLRALAESAPTTLGLPLKVQLRSVHVSMAAAAAMNVTVNAIDASPLACNALPALNPNQPNQRSAAPKTTNGMLCGSIGSLPNPARLP